MDKELDLAIEAYKHGNIQETFPVFQKHAETGNTKAMVYLAECYDRDCNPTPLADDEKAVYWYKKAADSGNADAQYYVGLCYLGRLGLPTDEQTAYDWIKKAAENGCKSAQREIKYLYGE